MTDNLNVSLSLNKRGTTGVAMGMLTSAVTAGEYTHVTHQEWESPADWAEVASAVSRFGTVRYVFKSRGECGLLVETDSSLVAIEHEPWYGEWSMAAATNDPGRAAKWAAALSALLPGYPPPPPAPPRPDNMVPVMFWMQDPVYGGASARRRDIEVTKWEDVDGNYPAATRSPVSQLMGTTNPGSGGKLMLFHGPPGTGKTRAILTLISEWRNWCTASVVTDPEKFFGDTTYMNDLVFSMEGRAEWLLLIVEDGDEFMNVGGRESKGQAIARLLNIGDGIIGQGLNLLTLISTNVDVAELNPAVIREGRCMANIEFPPFPAAEASEWLASRGFEQPAKGDLTLAQMFGQVRRRERAAELAAVFAD